MKNLLKKSNLDNLVLYMKSRTDLDLNRYRPTTLRRRISHRMRVRGFTDMGEYINCVYNDPSELDNLIEEITIKVTEFFRDRDVFNYLDRKVIPALIENKIQSGETGMTIWSAGCSTGEEAYSIAMLLADRIGGTGIRARVLGTDISSVSCRLAGKGEYSAENILKIPDEFRRKYVIKNNSRFSISSPVRKLVSFRVHNLFMSAPLEKVDMVLCRNVIIHFKYNYREEVLKNFSSVLTPAGFLMLGKSEAVSGSSHSLFRIVSPSIKLYRKAAG